MPNGGRATDARRVQVNASPCKISFMTRSNTRQYGGAIMA